MWSFSLSRALSATFATWPLIVARVLIYGGVTLAYVIATGAGATIGYVVERAVGSRDANGMITLLGAAFGFGGMSVWIYTLRELGEKAGHALRGDRSPSSGPA